MRALIVDDSRAARSLIRRMMNILGYDVTEAADGVEAYSLLRSGESFDAMLIDWNMPNMDGLELVRAIRKTLADAVTPLMMVTSESDPKKMARALMNGADEYLVKPIDVEMLSAKLELLGLPIRSERNQVQ